MSNEPVPAAAAEANQPQSLQERLLSPIGYILGISYPLLALSTAARGSYQLCCRDDLTKLGPALSLLTAALYLVAAIGFFKRTPRWWPISVGALAIEAALALIVGALSFIIPDVIGSTAWRHFGADYGFFPLFQPLLGLAWLLWGPTRAAFGVAGAAEP